MKRLRLARGWLMGLVAALAAFPLFANTITNPPPPIKLVSASTNSVPPHHTAPIGFFRTLLAMAPEERAQQLAIYPPPIREGIEAKIREYEQLDPNERELRLRATELRWYLLPLLRESPTNRAAQLAQVPDDLRDLVQSRLDQWIILPEQLQQEFLDSERVLHYFARVGSTNGAPAPGDWGRTPPDSELARWNALPEDQRKRIAEQVNRFFALTPDEKQETLNTLSDVEREQMEETLKTFDNLPAAQRTECIRAFAKFASMNAAEKREFLRNAERWSQMTPAERQTWRDLVANVPNWPPMPPMPDSALESAPPPVATNH
ncbi:MAG TPA: DUF3106 domain-containing protein [Verrucomicrobiae bacterium]|nr:DUF3106 domain-containing protein [Verrucomicrobiae bacterium]